MGESQSLRLQVQKTAQWARRLSVSYKEGSRARWAVEQMKQGRAEPLSADAKGNENGMEQHFGVWSLDVSAVTWILPHLYLESSILHPSGSFQ